MMNMFLVYIASISDNLHAITGTILFVAGFLGIFGVIAGCVDIKSTYAVSGFIHRHLKSFIIGFIIVFAIFILTPNNCRHDLDIQYIRENNQLRMELNDVTRELNACQMKRGVVCRKLIFIYL